MDNVNWKIRLHRLDLMMFYIRVYQDKSGQAFDVGHTWMYVVRMTTTIYDFMGGKK